MHATRFIVVVLGGTDPDADPLATRPFAESLVATLADAGVPVAAVEADAAGDAWVAQVAADSAITVVGADGPAGTVALILGLLERIRTGDGGAYGGERAPLPALP